MQLVFSRRFDRSLRDAPKAVQTAFWKQAETLTVNPRHPSLRTKKYRDTDGLWQARVTRGWRLYFTIENDTYYLVDITSHPK
jgi:mRNA-degrading endonuclease RelE of RelBE toxin-antitoxin system